MLIFALFAMSLDLLIGFTGMASLGHAAYFGLSAYVTGLTALSLGWNVWLALPAGLIASVVAASLFGDGCAAVVITDKPRTGAKILSSQSYLFPDSYHFMGFDTSSKGFTIVLDKDIPDAVTSKVAPMIDEISVEGMGRKTGALDFFVFHPGGRKVLSEEITIGANGGIDIDRCIRFGYFLGTAFQIQDDLLNLEGDAKSYGKELGGDIREGKRTLMIIHLIANGTPEEVERLRNMLGQTREARSDEDVAWVRELMEKYGSINYARQVAQGLAGAAQHEFAGLYGHLPESRDKQFLAALPEWVIERN
mgnify:CR=1 FL=1